jgi:hypothetical protein
VLCRCDVLLPVWIGSYRGPSALRGLLGFLGHVGIHGGPMVHVGIHGVRWSMWFLWGPGPSGGFLNFWALIS